MCGILGFVGKGERQDAEKMLATLKHRGPDDSGIETVGDCVVFGHARLSILDISMAGHQPMWSDDKKITIVFNGEIYNFKELKDDLISKGYTFKSDSDTEVIIYLYKTYGEDCFSKMNGMFALGIFDISENKLVLARDRIGKKPLYYFHQNGSFAFASELKALARHSALKKEIDLEALNKYLLFDYVPTPYTILKNVKKLEPGSYLIFKDGNMHIKKFWDIGQIDKPKDFKTALQKLDTLIEQSVKARLISDVPLGVFLSGGLDSSTAAYYAQKVSKEKIKTFSIGFDELSFDESIYAEEVARHLKTDHHVFKFGFKEVLELVPKIGEIVDEPLGDASILPTYLLSRETKKHVTVVLGGDGADELFAGYPTFQAQKLLGFYQWIPRIIRNSVIEPAIKLLPVSHTNFSLSFKLAKFIDAQNDALYRTHQNWLGSFQEADRENVFKKEVWKKVSKQNIYESVDNYAKNFSGEEGNKTLYTYMRSYLMDEVMVKVDRASMKASLEARSPLLDYNLVEFVFSLPYAWKMKGFVTKYIFKKLMEGKLPKNIIYRSKKGFGIPIGRWFKDELKDFVDKTLSYENIERGNIFNYQYIEKLKTEHFSGRRDHRKKLWTLIVFELWRKEMGL